MDLPANTRAHGHSWRCAWPRALLEMCLASGAPGDVLGLKHHMWQRPATSPDEYTVGRLATSPITLQNGNRKGTHMKKFILSTLIAAASTAGVIAQDASENANWRVSVGPSYRTFEGVELKAFELAPGTNTFLNGSVTDVGAGNYTYTVEDSVRQVDNASLDRIEYQNARLDASDENLQDAPGATLRFSRPLIRHNDLVLDLELSLVTAFLNDDLSAGASTTTTQFDISPNTWPSQGGPGGGPDPDVTTQTYSVYNRSQITSPISEVTARVNYRFNMDVYTLGAGLNARQNVGPVQLTFGGGPTLSIIPYDAERSATAAWASDDTTFFTRRDDADRDVAAHAGMYARAGVQWPVTERLAFGAGARYDWIPRDMNTDFTSFDLSGLSAVLNATFTF